MEFAWKSNGRILEEFAMFLRKVPSLLGWVVAVGSLIIVSASDSRAVSINEIRIDQLGGDDSEYFELTGTPGESLDGLWYVTLGDTGARTSGANGFGNSGAVETALALSGSIPPSGFFLATEETFENGPGDPFDGVIPDLVTADGLAFENSDNVTHLLVRDFTGASDDDLDTDDDGVLDIAPWSAVVDAVGLIETAPPPADSGEEWTYGAQLGFVDIGPDGPFVPAHVLRFPDRVGAFQIAPFRELDLDTPGAPNRPAMLVGDMDLDDDVDFDDIAPFVLALNDPATYQTDFGVPGSQRGDTDGDGDLDFDDIPGFVALLQNGAPQTVPEPSSWMLGLLGGLAGLLGYRRTR